MAIQQQDGGDGDRVENMFNKLHSSHIPTIFFAAKKWKRDIFSPLYTIRLYSRTMTKSFFHERIWISRNGAKTPIHTVRHRQQFSRIWIFRSEQQKIAFEFCPETAPLSEDGAERRTKNLFAKHRQKCSTHYSRFVAFSLFR